MINGVAAVPMMVLVMLMAGSARVMGQFTVTGWLRWLGWTATVAMGLAALGIVWPD